MHLANDGKTLHSGDATWCKRCFPPSRPSPKGTFGGQQRGSYCYDCADEGLFVASSFLGEHKGHDVRVEYREVS